MNRTLLSIFRYMASFMEVVVVVVIVVEIHLVIQCTQYCYLSLLLDAF